MARVYTRHIEKYQMLLKPKVAVSLLVTSLLLLVYKGQRGVCSVGDVGGVSGVCLY